MSDQEKKTDFKITFLADELSFYVTHVSQTICIGNIKIFVRRFANPKVF